VTSVHSLSLQELADFSLGAWDLLECLDCNFRDRGYEPREVHGFVLSASSDFYPEFDALVRHRIDEWLARVRADAQEE
jgi:hypothetical protein